MKSKNLIYLVSSATPKGVLESQVFNIANYINQNYKHNIKIILVGKKINIKKLECPINIEFHFLNETISIKEISNSNIYIRGVDIFLKYFITLKLNKNKLIYDFRALAFVESYLRNSSYLRSICLFFLEMTTYYLADEICCVSNVLKNKLKKYFILHRRIFVFPCLIIGANQRNNKLVNNLDSTIKFVYLGSLSPWQKFDKTIDLFKLLSQKINCKLTVISNDNLEVQTVLKKKDVTAKILSLTHSEVLTELKNHHFGFLIRDNNLLNNISSPIKYLEYISSGVIPVVTQGIGDYTEEVITNNIGIVLTNNFEIDVSNIIKMHVDQSLNNRTNDYYSHNYNIKNRIKNHPILNH